MTKTERANKIAALLDEREGLMSDFDNIALEIETINDERDFRF